MANEDVLKRAAEYVDNPGTWALKGGNTIRLVNDLAAALREARGDTKRLDFLSEPTAILTVFDSGAYGSFGGRFIAADGDLRGLIDAAMKPPGGEGARKR